MLLLAKGIYVLRTKLLEQIGLDMYDFLSISSLADSYMIKNGSYDGVVLLSGPCREFI